jgi:hypothetical protein
MHFNTVLFSCSSWMIGTPKDAVKARKMHNINVKS